MAATTPLIPDAAEPTCSSFPLSALFILIARACHESRRILHRALLPRRAYSAFPDILAACHFNCYSEQVFNHSSGAAAPPNREPPSANSRFRLFGGLLAILVMRATSGRLSQKTACKMGDAVVSRVASMLLAETGEGFHHAGLQFRAACDNANAARCFSRAAELNHGPSHAELSYMFIGSCSMQKDLHVAYSIAEKGASLGCDDSKAALASCLRFVWRDEERAVQLAKESACAGSAWGCSELGLILQHGIGVERDVAQAVLYTAKAARHGNAWARNNLGIMYAKGFGVERDYRQAERYASRNPN